MRLVLLIGEECPICDDAKAAFEKRFCKEIIRGEAKVINVDDDEEYQEKVLSDDLSLAPIVLLETNDGVVISEIEPTDLVEYKPKIKEDSPLPETLKEGEAIVPNETVAIPLTNPI